MDNIENYKSALASVSKKEMEQRKIIKKLLQDKEELKKQLALYSVSNSKRINLMVFEENTRCYKLTNKELETYTKQGMIEKGDKHYKCELIKKY